MGKKKHSVDVLFMFILFAVFAVLSVLIIYIGSGVYDRISENKELNEKTRTTLSYVMNKVREIDCHGNVSIIDNEGVETLVLRDESGMYPVETLIYEYGGKLMEMNRLEEDSFSPQFGDVLLESNSISFEIDEKGQLLTIKVYDKAKEVTFVSCYLGMSGE